MKVGMIGLGAMGWNMASRVASAGYLAGVYNRTASKARQLAEQLNVSAYDSIAELAQAVDVLLICVSADADVLAVVEQIAQHGKAGSIVVDMSTVSSQTAQQASAVLAKHQIDFLDAPVSGGVEGAKHGTLAMMIGGSEHTLARVQPVLATMGKRLIHIGAVGTGQATKAVNQIMVAGINQAVTAALAFASAQGLPMPKVIDVIAGGAAGNWFLQHRGLTMTQGQYDIGFKLALHHKDLKICQTMAQTINMALPLVDQTLIDYEQLMQAGYGDEDISALYRLKR